MKKFFKLLLVISIGFLFFSCSEDDDFKIVTAKIYCDKEGVPATVYGLSACDSYCKINGFYEETARTDAESWHLTVTCDDHDALLTIEVYVNGNLVTRRADNGYLDVVARIR